MTARTSRSSGRRPVAVASAAQQTAAVLREEILGADTRDEWFLGSEDDLMAELGVSRPTLRQAAKLLQQEGLLAVRRGVNGGFFATRPTHEAVTHMASVVLRSEGATYEDLMGALTTLSSACTRLAAQHPERSERERALRWYDERLPDGPEGLTGKEFFPLGAGFHRLLAELGRNPTLQLFIDVLLELSMPLGHRSYDDPDIVARTIANHGRVASLVVDGEGEAAAAVMASHLTGAIDWADRRQTLAAAAQRFVG